MPRFLRLFLLGIRDLIASAGPGLLLIAAALVAAWVFIDPVPPDRVRLATGPDGSAYAGFGSRYAMALRVEGFEVEPVPTDGSADNLRLLRAGDVDVAFVRGGSADPAADAEAGLLSLGSLFYEPLWVFYRPQAVAGASAAGGAAAVAPTAAGVAAAGADAAAPDEAAIDSFGRLKGLRVNVDRPGSGVPAIVEQLLEANRLSLRDLTVSHHDPATAERALAAGELDAMVLISAPQSPVVQGLLRAPALRLLDIGQSEAYTRRFAFLSTVTLPRGIVDLADDLPPRDITLLATTTSLLSREATHPALRTLFARTAQRLHGEAGWFNRARDFPNTRTSELPVSAEGERAINGSPPFWDRWMPFRASNLVERMWVVIGGLLVMLLPLSRVVPPLYTYRVRRRVFRWYARLREIEQKTEAGQADRTVLLDELDELDRVAHDVAVPLAHAQELYALRANIERTRRRLLGQTAASR